MVDRHSYKSCKCTECRAKRAQIQRTYRRKRAEREHGVTHDSDWQPVGPTRQRLRRALRNGTTFREMEKLTGIGRSDLQRIANGNRKYVTRATYRKIADGVVDGDIRAFQSTTKVSINKSLQVMRSLSAQGWSQEHQRDIIRNNTEHSGGFLRAMCQRDRVWILKQNEDIMIWLENQIGARIGPGKKCKTWANKHGYFPLRHYDAKGDLVVATLSAEQRQILKSVQSTHG